MYLSVRMSQALAIDPHSLPPVAGFLLLVVTPVGLTLFFALLIHRYVEQPGIAAGRRFAGHILGESRTALAASIAGSAKSAGSKSG
jgi:peptidoglycan/LPS O-acetylase OafA/YrhL